MITFRARIFIIATIIVLLILGISIFFLILPNRENKNEQTGGQTNAPVGENTIVLNNGAQITAPKPKTLTTEEIEKSGVKSLAKIFIERYGTYSTVNPYQNIKDVETMVTPELWTNLEKKIKPSYTKLEFSAALVSALVSELKSFGNGEAQVVVSASKTEENVSGSKTSQIEYLVTLQKVGENWLIDDFLLQK